MIQRNTFLQAKEKALQNLVDAHDKKHVDQKVKTILDILNTSDMYYTLSSCSGRIVILDLPRIGDKQQACFLGKWHQMITMRDVQQVLEPPSKGIIWFLAQSPIFHIGVYSIEDADKLIKMGITSGFKNSGIRSVKPRIIVELCSTERLDAPIGQQGTIYTNTEYLELLIQIANQILQRSQEKLQRLEKKLRKHLSTEKSTNTQ